MSATIKLDQRSGGVVEWWREPALKQDGIRWGPSGIGPYQVHGKAHADLGAQRHGSRAEETPRRQDAKTQRTERTEGSWECGVQSAECGMGKKELMN